MSKRLDLTGQRFGRLEVLTFAKTRRSRAHWLCHCSCGGVVVVVSDSLRNGHTKSCGCLKVETSSRNGKARTRHGMYRTPTWNSWEAMQRRCRDPKNKDFHLYGGRGVRVCDEWDLQAGGSFENFLADMGERPEGTTLDKDKLGGDGCLLYSPETCCWLTPKEQAMHTRTVRGAQQKRACSEFL